MKILFIHHNLLSFVEKDLYIFRGEHQVNEIEFNWNSPKILIDVIKLIKGLIWADVAVCWFGKVHALFTILFSKIFGKKTVVIAGGDDVAKFTALGTPYGIFSHPVKKWFGKFIFKYASLIIAISKYNYKEIIENTPADKNNVKLVVHGFDDKVFIQGSGILKRKAVCTIGLITWENCWRKGYNIIKETARLMPETKYFIVGPQLDSSVRYLKRNKTDNLIIINGLYGNDLVKFMNMCSVYLQISEWESFGCALAEAMLCECVPVVFKGTSLPEVVGDCGYYIDSFSVSQLIEKIKIALNDNKTGKLARERIINCFSFEKRRENLLNAIDSLG